MSAAGHESLLKIEVIKTKYCGVHIFDNVICFYVYEYVTPI